MGTYRGRRHAMGLPVRGQRTRTQVPLFVLGRYASMLTLPDHDCTKIKQGGTRRPRTGTVVDERQVCHVSYCTGTSIGMALQDLAHVIVTTAAGASESVIEVALTSSGLGRPSSAMSMQQEQRFLALFRDVRSRVACIVHLEWFLDSPCRDRDHGWVAHRSSSLNLQSYTRQSWMEISLGKLSLWLFGRENHFRMRPVCMRTCSFISLRLAWRGGILNRISCPLQADLLYKEEKQVGLFLSMRMFLSLIYDERSVRS